MRHGADGSVWRRSGDGVVIRFHLSPKSSKDAIEGIRSTADGPAFKARVRAVPQDGEANRALEALVAEWLEVPKRGVAVTGGAKSRLKSVMVSGDAATLGNLIAAKALAS
jgi:uncharacterized protein (TIGR00251 family)